MRRSTGTARYPRIVEIAKTLYCTKVVRSAYWLNIDPTGMVEAGYGPKLK